MADPIEEEKRRREAALRAHDAHERDPAPLGGNEAPYDPDTGAAGTTHPRGVQATGSAGPTGVVPPKPDAGPRWRRLALTIGAVLLVFVLLLVLT